jgi:hypothetical protein
MRYRYVHEPRYADGASGPSTLIWVGTWPSLSGYFPPDHPRFRYQDEFNSLSERGYRVIFSCDGDLCVLRRLKNQTSQRVLMDLDDCLGWE